MARTARMAAIMVGALVTVTGCASSHDPHSPTAWRQPTKASWLAGTPNGRLYADPQGDYRLTIGRDWIPMPPPVEGTSGVYPEDEYWQVAKTDLGFAPTISIFADTDDGFDLPGYLEYSRQIPYGNKFLSIKTVKSNDGRDLGYLEFTGEPRNAGPTHYLAIVDVVQGRPVVATLAADESDFRKYRPKIEPFLLTLHAL
jgi:hypothetical protein